MIEPFRTERLLALPVACLATLLACDSGAQADVPAGTTASSVETHAAPSRAAGETWMVTIASGPFAGTHRGADEMNCILGEGSWSADLDRQHPSGVNAILAQLEGVADAGGTTDDAHLAVMFGQPGGSGWGGITAGGATGGTSRGTARREGSVGVIRIEAATAAGDRVSAELHCPAG